MNEYRIDDIEVGMAASFTKVITREMEDGFRAISGDENPLHWNDDFAAEASNGRFSGHVTFGLLTASFYSTLAGMYLPGKYSLIHSFEELSFLKPVYIGDELLLQAVVVEKNKALNLIRVKADIRNQRGQVVSRAKLKILFLK